MESAEFKLEAIEYLSSLTMGFGAELYNVVTKRRCGAAIGGRRVP
jgi:hypothetical protein